MKAFLTAALLTLILCSGAITSFAQKQPTTAFEYNQYIVAITDSLFIMGKAWGNKFNEVYQSKKYSELAPSRKKMESFIIRKQAILKSLKNIEGSEGLKKAQLDFLQVELDLVKEAFVPLEKLTAKSSDDAVRAALEGVSKGTEKEDAALQKVQVAQAEYAKKNGFRIAGDTEDTDN